MRTMNYLCAVATLVLSVAIGCGREETVVRRETVQTVPAPVVVEKRTTVETVPQPPVVEDQTTTTRSGVVEKHTTTIESE